MDLKTVIDSTPTLKKPRRTFTAEFKHQLIQQCQQPDTSVAKVDFTAIYKYMLRCHCISRNNLPLCAL
jgi:hypothetical protein